jgi:hypothetical protein
MFDNRPTIVDGNGELKFGAKAVVNVDDLDADVIANAATPGLFR